MVLISRTILNKGYSSSELKEDHHLNTERIDHLHQDPHHK